MNVLLVGGAGVTGTMIARQLLETGCAVTILHRGVHAAALPDSVTRITADPYHLESLTAALSGQHFDAVVALYGRLRYVMQALHGVTARVVTIGGAAPVYRGWGDMMAPNPWETTQPTPLFLTEDHPLASAETADRFSQVVRKTEQEALALHRQGVFNVTHFRYPLVYGPNNICPAEWGLVRRAREGRRPLIVPGGGLTVVSRGYAENVAHAIVLALQQPSASAGEVYNVCDAQVLSNAEWVSAVGDVLGHAFEVVSMPFEALPAGFRATPPQLLYRHHCVLSIDKLKQQLGYQDRVSVAEALARTVQWYQSHPLAPDSEAEQNLGDPFDYAYEDAFIAAWQQHATAFSSTVQQLPAPNVVWKHPYQQK